MSIWIFLLICPKCCWEIKQSLNSLGFSVRTKVLFREANKNSNFHNIPRWSFKSSTTFKCDIPIWAENYASVLLQQLICTLNLDKSKRSSVTNLEFSYLSRYIILQSGILLLKENFIKVIRMALLPRNFYCISKK